jgi:hypothetical protein
MNLGGEILIACLDAASPDALARLMLMQDPVAASLTVEQQYRLACAALEEGDKVGVTLCSRHQSMAPEAIACALGVTIVDSQEPSWAGPFLRYADYRSHPPEIRLFRKTLGWLDLLLAQPGIGNVLGIRRVASVFVAHELFHHIEATSNEPSLARRHAVTRLRVGTWRLCAPVCTLSEIAAGACAQAMLSLPYHPAILDFAALSQVAPQIARARAIKLVQICN